MGDITLVLDQHGPRARWTSEALPEDVIIGAEAWFTPSSGATTLATNVITIRKVEWWYGFAERVETLIDLKQRPWVEVVFDCIELFHFETSVPAFAPFYPPGIDDVVAPSVDYVYKHSLDAANTPADLIALDETAVANHIKVVDALLDGTHQCVVRLFFKPERGLKIMPDQWYILPVDPTKGPGMAAQRYRYPGAFQGTGAERVAVEDVFLPDSWTQRRLQRVISLDFVRDLNITPPDPGEGEPEPVLVLIPGRGELPESWQGWESWINDYGPVFWDEKPALVQVATVEQTHVPSTSDVRAEPEPATSISATTTTAETKKEKKHAKKEVKRDEKKQEKKSEKKPDKKPATTRTWTIYEDPPEVTTPSVSSQPKSTKDSGKPSRRPLARRDNLQSSPKAKEKGTRLRTEGTGRNTVV